MANKMPKDSKIKGINEFMRLSIIIPIYKVENYIQKCIESCIEQESASLGTDYELICVDDGSPDKSIEIVEKSIQGFSGVTIIRQFNSGLSVARNVGLQYAKGDFVWFVDSDDFIDKTCVGRLIGMMDNNVDIIQLNYRLVYEDNTPSKDVFISKDVKRCTGVEVTSSGGLPAPAQFCIYRKDFLKNKELRFYTGILHEDSEFKPRAVYYASTILFDNCISYNYLQRCSGSITSTHSLKRSKDSLFINQRLLEFAQQMTEKKCKSYFYWLISMNFNDIFMWYRYLNSSEKEQLQNELKQRKGLLSVLLKSPSAKHKIEGLFFLLNIKFGLFLHNLFR